MDYFLSRKELELRWQKLRARWQEFKFEPEGIFVFSRTWIYYFSGTWANGLLFLPLEGEPVLFCRKGVDRAKRESSLKNIVGFRSYSQVPGLLKEFGYVLKDQVGVQKTALSWQLAELFSQKLNSLKMVSADNLLAIARAVKTDYELQLLKQAGFRHNKALVELLPKKICPGMSEYEIGVKLWEIYFDLEHTGMMRMQAWGEEIFLGHIAAGDSGVYGSAFNGPLCLRGVHPLMPQMGSPQKIWSQDEPLTVDVGFCFQGYHTDKTQVYLSKGANYPTELLDAQKCCQDIQEMAREMLVPGTIPSQIYLKAVDYAKQMGFAQGFMGIGSDQVNFLGHGIGLFIDEFPAIAQKVTYPLEENMVIALEPKIGLPDLGMVGVENTFVVTAQGGKCLTGEEFNPIWIG